MYVFSFDLAHTVARRIIDDVENGRLTNMEHDKTAGDGLISLAKDRNVRCVSFDDWKRLDQYETNLGSRLGKPREKIIQIEQMIEIASNPEKST